MNNRVTEIKEHPHFSGLAVEIIKFVDRNGKERVSYRPLRFSPGSEKPFYDFSAFQWDAINELIVIEEYKARNKANREYHETNNTGVKPTQTRRSAPPTPAAESLPQSLTQPKAAYLTDDSDGTVKTADAVSYEDDDLPF